MSIDKCNEDKTLMTKVEWSAVQEVEFELRSGCKKKAAMGRSEGNAQGKSIGSAKSLKWKRTENVLSTRRKSG